MPGREGRIPGGAHNEVYPWLFGKWARSSKERLKQHAAHNQPHEKRDGHGNAGHAVALRIEEGRNGADPDKPSAAQRGNKGHHQIPRQAAQMLAHII